MSEKEKTDILKTISKALPNMSDFDKGYFLGVAESNIAENENKTAEEKAAIEYSPKDKAVRKGKGM